MSEAHGNSVVIIQPSSASLLGSRLRARQERQRSAADSDQHDGLRNP